MLMVARLPALLLAVLFLIGIARPMPPVAQPLHAILLRAEPADGSVLAMPPSAVHLWFSEPFQVVGQAITVSSPMGNAVQRGSVHINGRELSVDIAALKPGSYLVSWQVISQDTDPSSGRFVFSVGRVQGVWAAADGVSGPAPLGLWLQMLARFLHLLGYALGFGVLAFRWFVLRPLALEGMTAQRLWRLIRWGIFALVVAEPLALMAQNASLGTGVLFDPNLLGDILASSFGRVLGQRLGVALLLWICVGIIKHETDKAIPVSFVLALLLALIDGEASHAINVNPWWVGVLANALHIAAMGIWIGGLVALLAIWPLKTLQQQQRRATLKLFQPLALLAIVELVLSGVVMAGLHIPQLSALLTTAYGRTLTAKLSVLLAVLCLVAIHQWRDWRKKRAWWFVEFLALLGILLLAGLLVSLPPPLFAR